MMIHQLVSYGDSLADSHHVEFIASSLADCAAALLLGSALHRGLPLLLVLTAGGAGD